MGVIKIEGKSVTLDDAIIDAGIAAIKAALSVDFPDVENADIEIIGSRAPGVARSATVVKRGTGKGEHPNTIVIDGREVNREEVKQTIEHGKALMSRLVNALRHARPHVYAGSLQGAKAVIDEMDVALIEADEVIQWSSHVCDGAKP
jgi:hypothetical protein